MRLLSRLTVAAGAVLSLATPLAAGGQVAGFDNLACGGGSGLGTYLGFNWNGFLCYDATLPSAFPTGLPNGLKSAKNVIYNRGGSGSSITRGLVATPQTFNFTSAYIARAVPGLSETYRFTGMLGASVVGFVDVAEPVLATLFAFNFANVDEVLLTNISNPIGNGGLVMDDITFDPVPAGPVVPEPATMVLMGTGLAGIALIVRRRRVA